MAAGPESSEGQTRGELVQTLWKTALATGAAQTLLAPPSFAEVRSKARNMNISRRTLVPSLSLLAHSQTSPDLTPPADLNTLYVDILNYSGVFH